MDSLERSGYRAFLVGGCVRDLLLGKEPKDWDVTTNARPEEIQKLFPDSVYENEFGTVGVKTDSANPKTKVIEVTTFRIEGKYSDKRHPDQVQFAKTIEEDLSRRDFTINAIAENFNGEIVDPYNGRADLKNKIVRTVGDPKKRFEEDALRLIRAVRFSVELGFSTQGGPASGWEIERETALAIKEMANLLEMIAKERIRDEFIKIIMAKDAAKGIITLEDLGLLRYVMPELREGIGCGQNKHHIYTVFDHNVRALNYTAEKNYSLPVRLASLLHDVGKPRTKAGDGPDSTFYNHETVGARMTLKILDRLRFSKELIEQVAHLVRSHLFYYNVGEVTEAGVRRFLVRVGPENIDDLLKVREADRIGSGVPKAFPYKLRHLLFMIEKVKTDPIHPKMLKVDGEDIMKFLNISPGPKIGYVLAILLEEVLDDPKKNEREYLESRAKILGVLSDNELEKFSRKAHEKKEEFEGGVERGMKEKYHVK
ncbi:MAG: HD domain-containing protein [Patescibacteria group bacterium]